MSTSPIKEAKQTWGRHTEKNRLAMVKSLIRENGLKKVLDFGCGQGAYIATLQNENIDCHGIDLFSYPGWDSISEELKKPVDELFTKHTDPQLPYEDNTFDLIFSFEVLEHCPQPEKILKELARVGKKHFAFSVPNCNLDTKLRQHSFAPYHWTDTTHVNHFKKESFQKFFTENGFKVVQLIDAYELDLNACYWDHVDLHPRIKNLFKRFLKCRTQKYFSSILVHVESV